MPTARTEGRTWWYSWTIRRKWWTDHLDGDKLVLFYFVFFCLLCCVSKGQRFTRAFCQTESTWQWRSFKPWPELTMSRTCSGERQQRTEQTRMPNKGPSLSNVTPVLPEFSHAYKSTGISLKWRFFFSGPGYDLKFCISNELPSDTNTADPQITFWVTKF